MSRKSLILITLLLFQFSAQAQYTLAWARTIGGSNWDESSCIIETLDGGIVMGGYTEQGEKDFGVHGYVVEEVKRGNRYPWLVKFDEYGKEIWGRLLDSSYHAEISDIVQLPDSSFVVSGIAYNEKWLTTDAWVARLDKEGQKLWEQKFGAGHYNEGANSVAYDPADGGFVLAGFSEFNEEHNRDGWIIKVDDSGNMLWDQIWGGKKTDDLNKIISCRNGGTLSVGYTMTGGAYKSTWVIRLDTDGNYEWDDNYKYSTWDVGTSAVETYDGGFAICGYTKMASMINYNVRVIKIDQFGVKEWDFNYGDVEWEEATDITETYDRGFAVSAFTKDVGGYYDNYWILYINRSGELEWEDIYGGRGYDYATNIRQTKDKGLIVGGSSYANEHLGWDFAVLKLTRDGISDYLLPQIKMQTPTDTIAASKDSIFNLETCINSIDSLRTVQIFVNDSLLFDNVAFSYSRADSTCNARISQPINLQEGENKIVVRAKNDAGESISNIYRVFYILIFKLGRW